MSPRRAALLASSPGLAVLVLSLGWWAVDRVQLRYRDSGVRLGQRLRSAARM